ncbi:hypothetical protein HNR23_002306 [Nocardiopsis mwathae]|uniref:Uncharacterized protein n=1 Tax=Nocardiopsis mwathae TaxID=1472723 RepID=A0A7W9YIP9_9ACTN|nr:hypothetical protein [Nocardiopsis mwathae]MBB6172246.1 hypothetical protein [Nocardiopsis mwathae]
MNPQNATHTLVNWILAPTATSETEARDAAAQLADLANATGAEGLTGAQVREQWIIPAEFELSDYDFMELVAFVRKAEDEGFDYAAEHYRPRFHSPELARWVGSSYDRLDALYASRSGVIETFWERPDAIALYNAHKSAS